MFRRYRYRRNRPTEDEFEIDFESDEDILLQPIDDMYDFDWEYDSDYEDFLEQVQENPRYEGRYDIIA